MSSIDLLSEAARWLVELETAERVEDIWPEFDHWFQASMAHRVAYARVRRAWLQVANVSAAPRFYDDVIPRRNLHWVVDYLLTSSCEWFSHWWPLVAAFLLLSVLYGIEVADSGGVVLPH